MRLRCVLLLSLVLAATPVVAQSNPRAFAERFVEVALRDKLLFRDSGQPVDRDFVRSCVRDATPTFVRLACDDLVPEFQAAAFGTDSSRLMLVVEDGASVAQLFAYRMGASSMQAIALDSVLHLSLADVARLTRRAFGDSTYTERWLRELAHSSFRVQLPRDGGRELRVLSSGADVPAREIGRMRWDGRRFVLRQ